jgi:hypothetical protein
MTVRSEIAQSPSKTNASDIPILEDAQLRRNNRRATIEIPCGYYIQPSSAVQRDSDSVSPVNSFPHLKLGECISIFNTLQG